MIKIIPLKGMPIVEEGDDIGRLIVEAAERQGTPIEDGDIIVVTHIIVSRAEGRVIDLEAVKPSEAAVRIAQPTRVRIQGSSRWSSASRGP